MHQYAYLLAYACCTLVVHRPLMTVIHLVLFCAIRSRSCHLLTSISISAISSLLQVFLGLPLPRFPWGFHCRACPVMLCFGFHSVCPIFSFLILKLFLYISPFACKLHNHHLSLWNRRQPFPASPYYISKNSRRLHIDSLLCIYRKQKINISLLYMYIYMHLFQLWYNLCINTIRTLR